MIVLLLLLIVAILLFGSASVLGAIGVAVTAVCLLIVGIVFWSAGWVGVLVLLGIIGAAIVGQISNANAQRDAAEKRRAQRDVEAVACEPVQPLHVREAIERDRRLNTEYRAKLGRKKGS